MFQFFKQQTSRLQLQALGLKDPLFFLGLALKLLFACLFASDYLARLFIPFCEYWVSSWANPWQAFMQPAGEQSYFPYPALMLAILTPVAWLAHQLETGTGWLHLLLYRLPVLAADFVILLVLLRWLKSHSRKVMVLYWLSPVLVYINYVHGQLDAIPVAFLVAALYFLSKNKTALSALLVGAAIACKTNMAAAVPFYFLYFYAGRVSWRQVGLAAGVMLVTFLAINLPVLGSGGFIQSVFNNPQQAKVFDLRYHFPGQIDFYFVPGVYLILFFHALTFRSFNRDVMLMFLGFAFGILTMLIPPMQGWYYWLMPFLVYFFVKQEDSPVYVFWVLQVAYFAYFMLAPDADFWQVWQVLRPQLAARPNAYQQLVAAGVNSRQLHGLVFTALQTALLVNVAWVYRKGVLNNIKYKIKSQPYLIGVGGDSGSGKSTFTQLLQQAFGDKNTAVVRGDDMHRWERGDVNWQVLTHLDPRANLLHRDLQHATLLKSGKGIARRHYDHSQGRFTLPKRIFANKVVVFEGLHPFFLARMRNLYDFRVFVKPDENLRLHWKIVRDRAKRGYTREMVMQQLERRKEDSARYIASQEQYAHMVITFCPAEVIADPGEGPESPPVFLKLQINNHIDPEPVLAALAELEHIQADHYYDDADCQLLELRGEPTADEVRLLADRLVPEMDDFVPGASTWAAGYAGLLQIMACYCIVQQMKMDQQHSH